MFKNFQESAGPISIFEMKQMWQKNKVKVPCLSPVNQLLCVLLQATRENVNIFTTSYFQLIKKQYK